MRREEEAIGAMAGVRAGRDAKSTFRERRGIDILRIVLVISRDWEFSTAVAVDIDCNVTE